MFLRRIYAEWRALLAAEVPSGTGTVLELGAGELDDARVVAGSIRSDVRALPGIDLRADARQLPFRDGALRSIVMIDVFHHIPDVACFLRECERTLQPGGRLVMIEPWHSSWSQWVYSHFHPEPYDPNAPEWSFPDGDPMLQANGALPWMVFERDLARFRAEFAGLDLQRVEPFMPFRYLLSGGLSAPSLQPGWMFAPWSAFERALQPAMRYLAMFALIVVERR